MPKVRLSPAFIVVLIILQGWPDYSIFFGHLLARFDGVVVAAKGVRYPPWTRHRAMRYTIRESDGREQIYIADPVEGGPDGFSVGTRLRKERGRLDYEENDRRVDDFPIAIYGFWVIVNTGLLIGAVILAIMIHIRDRAARELAAAFERAEHRLETDGDLPP
jgi:hypothetical protein